jgi:CRISPR-associated protein Cas2
MSDAHWWLVSYDVRDPKRLRKAAKLVEGHGHRVQYSVYRCWLSRRDVERLRWELTELLDPADDVLIIPLCNGCVSQIIGIHGSARPPDWPDEPPRHQIV